MRRSIRGALAVLVLLAGVVLATTAPAGAASNITATSVAPAAGDFNCGDADLDLGMANATTDTETGLVTNEAGETLLSFSDPYDLTAFTGVLDGYGMPITPDQPEGTIIGSYASLGNSPLSASNTAEFFVLYRCGLTDGTSTVLMTCFGDLGTCPQTAVEALGDTLDASLSPSSVSPGGTVTVSGTGCFDQLAGALLLEDGSATGVGDTVAPEPDGTFSIPLVVPADAAVGSDYSVQVDCGSEEGGVDQTLVLALQVVAASTPTTDAPPVAAPAVVTPAFTG